jgi:hypothetical protein
MRLAWLLTIPLMDIKNLMEGYIDLRMQAMISQETVQDTDRAIETYLKHQPPNSTFMTIPVSVPKTDQTVMAKVSVEDYDKIVAASSNWRLTKSGYPVFVTRKDQVFSTTYLHKLVHGSSARHVNGDRLDNRRDNLVDSLRGPPASRKRKSWVDEQKETENDANDEFKLFTPSFIADEICDFKQGDPDLLTYTGHANIRYNPQKHYSGSIKDGRPDGFGHLWEGDTSSVSCGMWIHGRMNKGMVVVFKPLPKCMCEIWKACPLRDVERVDVVVDGNRK